MKAWRIKGKIVSHVLHFSTTRAWVYICMFLSFGIFFALGIKDVAKMTDYAGWWLGITILFIALPPIVFLGIFRYRKVPKGWSEGVFKDWLDRHNGVGFQNVKGNGFRNWRNMLRIGAFVVGYVGLLNVILILVTTFDKSGIGIFVFIISAIIAPYVYIKIYRPNMLQNNSATRFKTLRNAGVFKFRK